MLSACHFCRYANVHRLCAKAEGIPLVWNFLSPHPPRNLFDSDTAPNPYNASKMPSPSDPSSPLAADSSPLHRPPFNPADSTSPNFTTQSPSPKKKQKLVFTEYKTRINFSIPLDIIKPLSNPDIPQYENAPPGLKENTAFLVKDLHNTERQKMASTQHSGMDFLTRVRILLKL